MPKFKVSQSVTTIILLLVTAIISTISNTVTEHAFAEKYRNNQAAATSNSCLNPLFESSTLDIPNTIGNCGNTVSQQEESGQASSPITLQTASPNIELSPSETSPPEDDPANDNQKLAMCLECFTSHLTPEQIMELEDASLLTTQGICINVLNLSPNNLQAFLNDIADDLASIGVDQSTISEVINCMLVARAS